MPAPITFQGQRVLLAPLSEADLEGMLAAAVESRDAFAFTPVPADYQTMQAYIQTALADARAGSAVPFTIWDQASRRIVGTTRFLELDYWSLTAWPPGRTAARPDPNARPSAAEVGNTWLAASAQGIGLNPEMKLLMLTHAFESWNVHRVSFRTDARNERSRAAIERVGARFEGIRRADSRAVDGTIRDSACYSIIASEWPAIRNHLVSRLRGEPPAPEELAASQERPKSRRWF